MVHEQDRGWLDVGTGKSVFYFLVFTFMLVYILLVGVFCFVFTIVAMNKVKGQLNIKDR